MKVATEKSTVKSLLKLQQWSIALVNLMNNNIMLFYLFFIVSIQHIFLKCLIFCSTIISFAFDITEFGFAGNFWQCTWKHDIALPYHTMIIIIYLHFTYSSIHPPAIINNTINKLFSHWHLIVVIGNVRFRWYTIFSDFLYCLFVKVNFHYQKWY